MIISGQASGDAVEQYKMEEIGDTKYIIRNIRSNRKKKIQRKTKKNMIKKEKKRRQKEKGKPK